MIDALFSTMNGSAPQTEFAWMQQSVQQFFGQVNWEDHPPEVQQFQQASGDDLVGSLLLTVSQFFGTVNWEGSPQSQDLLSAQLKLDNSLDSASTPDLFTLDEFSDLF